MRTELAFDIFIVCLAIISLAIIGICLLACYLFIQDGEADEHEKTDNSKG